MRIAIMNSFHLIKEKLSTKVTNRQVAVDLLF